MSPLPVQPRYPAEAIDTALLPIDPATGQSLPPTPQPGYYPGYSTLGQKAYWDEATRNVIEQRVDQTPPIQYFTPEQAKFWRAVFDHLLPQHDRTPDRRIPLVEPLDLRLYQNRTIGYRYESMPPDREAFSLGEQAINAEAQEQFGGDFVYLPLHQQELVLKAIHDGKPKAAHDIWKKMAVGRFWQMLMQDALEAYYAHPWSWDEIGFGGPAYPRAYTRLERGEPEPWEVEEQRYEWEAPAYAVSDVTEDTQHLHLEAEQNG
ncbi:MAG TPA: gluconate 2-dehydrogenase subunit 3 family protein [Acidobacteriaceae bacterium]|nr:gluconate 2-dehydrogenase subunit 3 family protein [Acidobacteriaceae bacterium]